MMRKSFRLDGHDFRELCLQHPADARMQFLALAAQEAVVSRVLNKRMLENERLIWRRAAAEDQPGADKLFQRVVKLSTGTPRERSNQFVGELSTDRRADLRDLLHG